MKQEYETLEFLLGSEYEEIRSKILDPKCSKEEKKRIRNMIEDWLCLFHKEHWTIVRIAFELKIKPEELYRFLD